MKTGIPFGRILSILLAGLLGAMLITGGTWALDPVILRQGSPTSLKLVPIPEPTNLSEYVADRAAAIILGKALFWDMQLGSDGIQSCGTCHFQAGADIRIKNQIGPGLLGGDTIFHIGAPNFNLEPSHFPLHQRADPDFQNSPITRDIDDVVGSMGVFYSRFIDIIPGSAEEQTSVVQDPIFNIGRINTRRVEPRNAPSTINAVFNFNNFWDGRAHNIFNGVNPFGPLDINARIWANNNGVLEQVATVALNNSSLASQAVGPPVNDFEMSAIGRPFPKIGKKMLSLPPLAKQLVHPDDSVLGAFSKAQLVGNRATGQPGINLSYTQLIQQAFNPKYWNSTDIIVFNGAVPSVRPNPNRPLTTDEFTQMEANFSLFFGLAIQLYEATLVSDETPFDRFAVGDNNALTQQQLEGLDIFLHAGKCINCHGGPEFTNASVSRARFLDNARHGLMETLPMIQGLTIYDEGYYNISVRPTASDLGRGFTAPFVNPLTGQEFPLSFVRLAALQLQGLLPFSTPQMSTSFPIAFIRPIADGRHKAPGLRNIELTGPYWHDGGAATLDQAVDFYTRGGNFPHVNIADLDPEIGEILLIQGFPERQDSLVAFLKALTDERVRQEMAPFDRPQLFIPNGHPGDGNSLTCVHGEVACDALQELPAVGADGRPAAGLPPLREFLAPPRNNNGGDFDGDGKADMVVYRRSIGTWFVRPSSGVAPFGVGWGGDPTDQPVPGDYDMDGKTDLAVYRSGTGVWFVVPSATPASPFAVSWGGDATDKTVPGDYDGDGKTDIAVYRGGSGIWLILPSAIPTSVLAVSWGGNAADKPAPGDYDGDGKTDIAVYRQGIWFVRPSSGAAPFAMAWGEPADIPVPGNYDGDQKTDLAVYRASSGEWFVVPSATPAAPFAVGWGGDPTDKPVLGDYDGDGKVDTAVYRAASGVWFVRPSSGAEPYAVGWGGDPSDIAIGVR